MNFGKKLKEGLITQNPVLVQVLGMCSTMAITTSFFNGLGMGVSVLIILTLSNIFISLLKKVIPNSIRIPSYIVIIASFVTILEMLMHAYLPSLYDALGIYLSLIVVNCVILGRAEAFANKNSVFDSALDGIGMGLGFTLGLTIIAAIREILGSGTITLFAIGGWNGVIKVPLLSSNPVRVVGMSAGALLVMGLLKAFFTWRSEKKGDKR